MTTQLSPYLLSPDIDLTSEEIQWRDVELWYRQVCFDEFQFTDRLKYFALRWLLENRKWPELKERWLMREDKEDAWNWFYECDYAAEHGKILPSGFELDDTDMEFTKGHLAFGDSILWFCSLWPRFYVECVLPQQIDEPANAEEFWENLALCVPGEDWRKLFRIHEYGKSWIVTWEKKTSQIILQRADNAWHEHFNDPHYRWSYGNAILRAVKSWRGTE